MWLPLTNRRSALRAATPARRSTSTTHGPAALTRMRAATSFVAPSCSIRTCQRLSARLEQRARPQAALVGQNEAQRPDQVRRARQQDLAFGQRLADQAERPVLEIAQPAVDQLARSRGGGACEVPLLDELHRQAAAGGVAGDPDAVDAAADNQHVEDFGHGGSVSRDVCSHFVRTLIICDMIRLATWIRAGKRLS